MKKLTIALAITGFLTIATIATAELVKVETLTDSEVTQLKQAEKDIRDAQSKLESIHRKIMAAHNMEPISWPEWANEVEINGKFILLYHVNHMQKYRVKMGAVE